MFCFLEYRDARYRPGPSIVQLIDESPVFSLAIVDALSDPKKFLAIAEKRADQMRALGIETVLTPV